MKYIDFMSELKNVLIGSSRAWLEIPMNPNYPDLHGKQFCKKLLNISTGTILTVHLDQNEDILKVE